MVVKAVQQIMLGSVCKTEAQTRETLKKIKEAGFDGIELNGFMIQPTSFLVRAMTKAAGMPVGKGGNFDWVRLVKEADLKVVSLHSDLGTLKREPEKVIAQAKAFDTDKVVITGMYRFDYSDLEAVDALCKDLNSCGARLREAGIQLLYHNHNCEFRKLSNGTTAYAYIVENTDANCVNFEFDSYWPTEAGVDAYELMLLLGERMKLYHVNDRGTKVTGPAMTPILKSDSMELGTGNMNLHKLLDQACNVNVEAIILESHKNWIENSPIKSIQVSGEFMKKYFEE